MGRFTAAVVGLFLCGAFLIAVPAPRTLPVRDLEFHKAVPGSKLSVSVTPAARAHREGKVLVLTVRIRNESREEVVTRLAHEWHGGEWPPTDLFASAIPNEGKKASAPCVPVYLAGEDAAAPRARTLPPGEAIEVNVRVDWPGTGSVKANPLMQTAGDYKVQLLLVFTAGEKKQYISGAVTTVRVPKEE
jgi:hypothetical protein